MRTWVSERTGRAIQQSRVRYSYSKMNQIWLWNSHIKKITSPMAKNALSSVYQYPKLALNASGLREHSGLHRHCKKIINLLVKYSYEYSSGLTSDDLRDSVISGNEACPALGLRRMSRWILQVAKTWRTKVNTNTVVIKISATLADNNQTRAGQWSSGLRENSLILTSRTVVYVPPPWH